MPHFVVWGWDQSTISWMLVGLSAVKKKRVKRDAKQKLCASVSARAHSLLLSGKQRPSPPGLCSHTNTLTLPLSVHTYTHTNTHRHIHTITRTSLGTTSVNN